MYPTLSDLIQDIFGLSLPLPIQTFGLMLAISFICAAYTLSKELQRKENQGLLKPLTVSYITGAPATFSDYLSAGLFGFIIGFKIIYAALDYSAFVENPQQLILSLEGNWFAGVVLAAAMIGYRYYESKKQLLPEPVTKQEQIHPYQLIGNITMIAAIAGILGAKIFHNLENLHEFERDPWDAIFSFSGLTFYGGLICAAFAVLYFTNKKGIPPLVMCDATAAGLMLAYGTGRLGCHLSGDGDWGIVNDNPKPGWLSWAPDWLWSYSYPHNVVGEGVPIPGCEGKHCFELIPPVYPTPFYEAIVCILLFFLLWSVRKKFTVPGVFFCTYLILNGIERYIIEHIRVNNVLDFVLFKATQAEFISVALIIAGIGGIIYLKMNSKEKPVNLQQ